MGYAKVLLGVLLVSALSISTAQPLAPFKCSKAGSTCTALIDYVSPNKTTLSVIQNLFQVKKFRNLLGVNNFSSTASENQTISAQQKIRIPFTCFCSNGTGLSNRSPVYTVVGGDGLDHIAAEVFSRLVTYQEIAAANGVADVNKIDVGQELWIPLPCSCDDVDGLKVVHYGHLVDAGSTVDGIAEQYGTTSSTLLSLNQMTNASDLKAAQVLDVPLKACTSNISSTSLDYPLLVAKDTYFYTARNCIKCACDPANNYTSLKCEASGLKPLSNWTACPAMQCEGAGNTQYIGNVSSSGCNQTTCAYTGYDSQTIFASLVTESTCPASDGTNGGIQGLRWNFLFISTQLIFICLHLSH
ncbi:lysM domain-containing GPI-anchored protein 2-like [Corylus avellana]|uniref:lysM domain-containing GPI-anchored protein 2-like n=1 Tax=Corylus avellana TaxID=13451 RepID=UPI00286A6053|nr:lysM domain-containing GPI-anchored protein 2-like [Corylus avellana]